MIEYVRHQVCIGGRRQRIQCGFDRLQVALGRFSPGARVTVELPGGRRLVREVQAGSSYLSSEDPRVHFGLGKARRVKSLVVRFPDGRTVRRANIAADQVLLYKLIRAGVDSRRRIRG